MEQVYRAIILLAFKKYNWTLQPYSKISPVFYDTTFSKLLQFHTIPFYCVFIVSVDALLTMYMDIV